MILIIDNYDSFVFNLARYVTELGQQAHVVRNDQVGIDEIDQLNPSAIIISPGPCTPEKAGISQAIVRELGSSVPILGVCLGHQAIATAVGGQVIRASEPVHGRTSMIHHNNDQLFAGFENPFSATRYHSLIIAETSLPDTISVIARTENKIPMAIVHRDWPVWGVQFHPESILTQNGHRLIKNFLELAGEEVDANLKIPQERSTEQDSDDHFYAKRPFRGE